MKILITILASFIVISCANVHKSDLIGIWKSNEEKTINSMNTIEGITPKAKAFLTDDFFGHLIVEYRENEARAYFDNCGEKCFENCDRVIESCNKSRKFTPYELIEETEEYFIILNYDDLMENEIERKLYREGECYYLFITKWKFKEFFCKENIQ